MGGSVWAVGQDGRDRRGRQGAVGEARGCRYSCAARAVSVCPDVRFGVAWLRQCWFDICLLSSAVAGLEAVPKGTGVWADVGAREDTRHYSVLQ